MMHSDVLILGSGIAGLSVALEAAREKRVLIVTKDSLGDSNTSYAQGGIAAAIGRDDHPGMHVEDTIRTGDGLVREGVAKILAESIPEGITALAELGVRFEKEGGSYKLSREAVHSRARIVHVSDLTGKAVSVALAQAVRKHPSITILEHALALDLIKEGREGKGKKERRAGKERKTGKEGKACVGARVLVGKEAEEIRAAAVVIATGGVGRLYERTTNPEAATGDGIAMAWRAGAILEDLEFMQFHPTMLHQSSPSFLISETLRGEGGLLVNRFGKAFMKQYHRDGDLAPRDVVSRFCAEEMRRTRSQHVWLDMTHLDASYLRKRFPHINAECLKYGVDLTKDRIPVSPAAHYLCGGVKVDDRGKTNIPGLYAVGECACTGLHGADRLASNSLAEGWVFGKRAGEAILHLLKEGREGKERKEKESGHPYPSPRKISSPPSISSLSSPSPLPVSSLRSLAPVSGKKDVKAARLTERIQRLMWKEVGMVRTVKGMEEARRILLGIREEAELLSGEALSRRVAECGNLAQLAVLVVEAALRRKESRGTHFVKDFPERDDARWKRHLTLGK